MEALGRIGTERDFFLLGLVIVGSIAVTSVDAFWSDS